MKHLVRIGNDVGIDVISLRRGVDVCLTFRDLKEFYEAVVEECAVVAEMQGRVYTGELNESAGCSAAANAIRSTLRVKL